MGVHSLQSGPAPEGSAWRSENPMTGGGAGGDIGAIEIPRLQAMAIYVTTREPQGTFEAGTICRGGSKTRAAV